MTPCQEYAFVTGHAYVWHSSPLHCVPNTLRQEQINYVPPEIRVGDLTKYVLTQKQSGTGQVTRNCVHTFATILQKVS